jgi:hypothetical protein
MKKVCRWMAPLPAVFSLLLFSHCGPETPERPIEEVQFEKLSGTWAATDVTLDGTSRRAEYANFRLTIAGTVGQATFTYSTQGATALLTPWPRNGNWRFGEPAETVIIRMDSPDLPMTYSVTATQLQISFNFGGTGFQPTRTAQVRGDWVFTFSK